MSGAALAWAKSVTAPSRTAKALLICLADYADADGCAWPKIKRLAAETQSSDSTVQRAIRQLEAAGLVERKADTRHDGGQTSNRYVLALPRSQNDTPPVAICDPPGRTGDTPPVAPTLPPIEEPPIQPPKEQSVADAPKSAPSYPPEFESAWSAYPHVKGRSSKAKTFAEWKKLSAAEQAALPAGCLRAKRKATETWGGKGAPAMERWLRDGKHTDWLTDDRPRPALVVTDELRRQRLVHFRATGEWRPTWGDPPDDLDQRASA